MVLFRCFSIKKNHKPANEDFNTLLGKLQHTRTSSETRDLELTTLDVSVRHGIQKFSSFNGRFMSLESESSVTAEVEKAYEGEDGNGDSHFVKRELSDFDLQCREVDATKEGCDSIDKEMKCLNQTNNESEDKIDRYSQQGVDLIHSGHVSDPGIGKADFRASPKLKRSCSNLEKRDLLRKVTQHLPLSKSESSEDFQELSANPMVIPLKRSMSLMSHYSADKVMLKKHFSSQILPSRSRKLWWKLFMSSHRNIHRTLSRKPELAPASGALKRKSGYASNTLESEQSKALRHAESSESIATETFNIGKNIDDQRRSRSQIENFGFRPRNQWFAFSADSSFARVDAWVKDLEIQQPIHEDDLGDDNAKSIVFPPSPNAGPSMTRSTSQLTHLDANLSKEILNANSVVQSLNPASSVAHISGVGIKAIPVISHLTNLRSVNLSNNFIVRISPGFLPKSIHTLNLSRNKISNLEGLKELTRLRVLDLSYNRISRIGQGFSRCTLVKELYLAGNKISDIEGLHRLFKLTVLDLSFNKIIAKKALGQLVANYNSLQALNLLGNPIQSNMNDEQLSKAVCDLLPKLVYLNKQPLKPQREREIFINNVAKAALGNTSRSSNKRSLKRVGQGGPSSSRGHSRSASVARNNRNQTKR